MQEPRSFIVRMYRLDPEGIAGVVEDVGSGRSVPFHSLGELWAVLTRALPPIKRRRPDGIPPELD